MVIGMLVFEVKGCGYDMRSFWWGIDVSIKRMMVGVLLFI